MKVAVIAGTAVDTEMGVNLLKEYGFKTIYLPISDDCNQQNKMQFFSKEKLQKIFEDTCIKAVEQGSDKIFIYCNSLSASVDYIKVADKLKVDIITPLESYADMACDLKNIVILAANSVSSHIVDKIISKSNPDIRTVSIGNLSIVEQIEEGKSPEDILEELNLKALIEYFDNIKTEKYKIDAIVLACTHFPYIKSHLQSLTDINIIEPLEDMIKRLGNIA